MILSFIKIHPDSLVFALEFSWNAPVSAGIQLESPGFGWKTNGICRKHSKITVQRSFERKTLFPLENDFYPDSIISKSASGVIFLETPSIY